MPLTGYMIEHQRDYNPRSPLYSTSRVNRTYDPNDCGAVTLTYDYNVPYAYIHSYVTKYVLLSKETISNSDEYFSDPYLISIFDNQSMIKGVAENGFNNWGKIETVDINDCRYVSSYGLKHRCGNGNGIISLNLPNCSYFGDFALEANTFKSYFNISNAEYIGKAAFAVALSYSSLSGAYSSANLLPIESLYLPKCSYIGEYAFYYHVPQRTVNLPLVKSLPPYCLYRPINITKNPNYRGIEASLPECEYIDSNAIIFGGSVVSLPKASVIKGSPCGTSVTSLRSIYLGYSGVVSFESSLVYNNWGDVTIYVPTSLYSDYIETYGEMSAILYSRDSSGSVYKVYRYYSKIIKSYNN